MTPDGPETSEQQRDQARVEAYSDKEWSARGAHFLTEPKDHGFEIRVYIRDPDGHLIEVGELRM